ncbi:UNVERIFIED_CONTAM: (S)-8-oxocitronellyl enol synthase CYC2 [Sesamum radiatum]|uniref:(S)-8-oxocitronellyl enol synthase CYC2 n=1 Tax=Sesamum radiatum TaxID=300843 RepID=A0AAW2M331_SESRA
MGRTKRLTAATGTFFKWKHFWKILADKFEVEYEEFDENQDYVSLVERMKDKGPVWDEIVKKNNLTPTKLEQVSTFWFVDLMFGWECMLDNMNKSKEEQCFESLMKYEKIKGIALLFQNMVLNMIWLPPRSSKETNLLKISIKEARQRKLEDTLQQIKKLLPLDEIKLSHIFKEGNQAYQPYIAQHFSIIPIQRTYQELSSFLFVIVLSVSVKLEQLFVLLDMLFFVEIFAEPVLDNMCVILVTWQKNFELPNSYSDTYAALGFIVVILNGKKVYSLLTLSIVIVTE